MFKIADETPFEVAQREVLLDRAMGADRFEKTSERLREGRLPADGLSLVARADDGGAPRVVGTVRLWHISAGRDRDALLLGPLAVDPDRQSAGIGVALMREALDRAAALGHRAVLLVGDAPYYARFGFSADKTGRLWLPGPYARDRFLARELVPGALDGAQGLVGATGEFAPRPDLGALVAAVRFGAGDGVRAA